MRAEQDLPKKISLEEHYVKEVPAELTGSAIFMNEKEYKDGESLRKKFENFY